MAGDRTDAEVDWVQDVLREHEARLVRYAARITGDDGLARDAVQETLLRLARQDRGALDGHLAQWLYTVCRHCALDIRRKETRMQPLPAEHAGLCESNRTSGLGTLENREQASRIAGLLAVLPAAQQEAVRLKFEGGLRYREIAAVMGLSVSHVGVLLHHALTTLRRELNEPEE